MNELYTAHGVQFRYPGEWQVSEQRDDGQVSITVSSPHTSFWTLTLLEGRPDPHDIVEAVVAAFRDEYEELDVYESRARVGQRKTVARDIDFVCLELLNTAKVRAFRTPGFTAMVLYQATDQELEQAGPVFEQITLSLACGDESPEA
ncbi:MAG: hypothetical protein ACT4QC_09495 [Planctomycetaceae bacterium]